MDRRNFLKTLGFGAASVGMAACAGNTEKKTLEEPVGTIACNFAGTGILGFGTMRFPKIKAADGFDVVDQEKVNEMVDMAIAHGVNYFDTAPVYLGGESETATGIALSRHPRESYQIATKLSNFRGPYELEDCADMYRRSLKNLQTDYLDCYLLHSVKDLANFNRRFKDNKVIDFLLEERKAGRIRKLGYSFHGDSNGFDELLSLHDRYHWDFVQIQMNYMDWKHAGRDANAEYMYGRLLEAGIPVVIMEPLLGGRLADVPAGVADILKAGEPDKSIASWAFRFCGSFPNVLTVLSGMNNIEHLKDNLGTFIGFKPLGAEEMEMLEKAAETMSGYDMVDCTDCRYCMPCPYGIDIPGVFRFYNNSIKDNSYIVSSEQRDFAKARRKYLAEYDKAVETLRQPSHCIGCGQCTGKCPQRINIPRELHTIDGYIEKIKQGKL